MLCESYKQALTDAAAANASPSRELAAHLNACISCREFFAAEQQLFASINSGVQRISNAEVPTSLLPTVRARMAEQKGPRSYWLPIGAMAATALTIAVFLYQENKRTLAGPEGPSSSVAAMGPGTPESPREAMPRKFAAASSRKPVSHRSVSDRPRRAAEAAVLVPAGQQVAFDRLLAGLQNGSVKPDVFAVDKPEQAVPEPTVTPLAITPVEIKPLAAVDEESARANESSDR